MNRSLTISSILVALLGFLLDKLGISVGGDELTAFITLAMQLGGILFAWYGRYRVGDVTLLGGRRI